ncbi:thymidylate synthase [Roseobacter phage CRP-403]|uniref:Thymidylate synthase n=1 Tax=Roseobacter phage CRP-403 TaxID=3072849 RepID=A0AAX3ZXS7_9CAUD|nr:thymidylate synthase [Roseobacter phage CRP-403]
MIKVEYVNHMGDDLTVVNAARVSFNKKSDLECIDLVKGKYAMRHKDQRLIEYLAKHKHISPFGHCFASFHVKAPVFVARQLVKHKFLRWNEVSRRYVDEDPEFYTPTLRESSSDKKQGSGGPITVSHQQDEVIRQANIQSLKQYQYLLKTGVCEEQARMILPLNHMTEWYWSGSLDAFADMCGLRCKLDTQQETREVAIQIDEYMEKHFPVSWKALRKYNGT